MSVVKADFKKTKPVGFSGIRSYFPIFEYPENRDLVYLDSAATSQQPQQVLDAVSAFSMQFHANTHRGAYRIAEKATASYEAARKKVKNFINARSSREIIFVSGATEAVNFTAYGWGLKNIKPGDEIIVSEMEHHSNLIPWQMAAQKTGADLKFLQFDENGYLDQDQYLSLLSEKTKLVAVTHVSNVLGTHNPVKEMIQKAHEAGAVVIVDGSQAVPHLKTDVQEIDADFYVFSGHKMLGPTGIGVLYGKESLLENMDPVFFGGSMISDVDYYQSTWNELPWKLEAGTQNISGAIGLGAAIDFMEKTGMENIKEHDLNLTRFALENMSGIEGLKIYGPLTDRGPAISFELEGIHAHDLATFLDSKNIAIRAGHHCAKLAMKRLGVQSTARASFYLYNTHEEIERFIKELKAAKRYFSKWN